MTLTTGSAEPTAALAMPGDLPDARRVTVGADKAYHAAGFVAAARTIKVTPHVS